MQVSVGGRPSKYRPEYCEQLIKHMASGLSFESFAAELDTCRDTLYTWRNEHKQFSDAYKTGLEKCLNFWEKIGLSGATGRIKGFKEATYIYNMNNRFRRDWKNSAYISREDAPPAEEPTQMKDVTPDEPIDIRIERILKRLENDY